MTHSLLHNPVDRRTLLKKSLAASLGATLFPVAAAENVGLAPNTSAVRLREKFFGCITGVHLGSAMAAPVEGWSCERIEREHGTLYSAFQARLKRMKAFAEEMEAA